MEGDGLYTASASMRASSPISPTVCKSEGAPNTAKSISECGFQKPVARLPKRTNLLCVRQLVLERPRHRQGPRVGLTQTRFSLRRI